MHVLNVALAKTSASFFGLWVSILLFCTHANAGFYLEHEAVIPNPQTQAPTKIKIRSWQEGTLFKRESPQQKEEIIINTKKGFVYGVNHNAKTFWKLSTDKYKALARMSLLVMGVGFDPQTQAISVPDGIFTKSGKTATIAGNKAYEVTVGGALPQGIQQSFWLSKDVPASMKNKVSELKASLGFPKDAEHQKLFAQWMALEGYPVQSVTTMTLPQGTIITSETLIKCEKRKFKSSTFEVPGGYSLTEDPITLAQRAMQEQMARQQQPQGLTAPLGQLPPAGK